MSYYAQIDENLQVTTILVYESETHSEAMQWLTENFGGTWLATEYDNPAVKPAAIGDLYNDTDGLFYPPKPYDSWTYDTKTFTYVSPIPKPSDGKRYAWNEEITNWVEVTND